MKKRIIVLVAIVGLLLSFWPVISKTATGIASRTIQVVDHLGNIIGTGGATAGPNPSMTVNIVDSTNHIIDSFNGPPFGVTTLTAHGFVLGEGSSNVSATAACGTGSIPFGQTAADPICSTLLFPNAATQGDLITATGANALGSLAAVAVGRVLISQGTSTVPAWSASSPSTNNQVAAMTTAGVLSWIATEAHISGGTNTYGNNTPFPTGVPIMQVVATNSGHFTQLTSTNITLNAGSCTTAPTFNVFDGASNLGTAKIASTTTQAKNAPTTQVESLTFAAGDTIGIIVSTQGGTCLAPIFAVDATVVYP